MTDDPIDPRLQEIAQRVFDAARAGDTSTLAAYLEAGVPVNLANGSGDTLLMLAAYHGHAEAVQLLIDRGADVDRLNERGQSPVAGAIFKGEAPVVRVLAAAGADPNAGHPTAVDSAKMFGREDYLTLWDLS
ncbi:ankyrin repeat domain-containing protein [Rhodococcus sp. NPDC127528]|uniref:ankyrin repeat domain-containing protein n=1 Tax=unclassified Rhodococcus (in: high G+C Gram-positive bacteria) TaxID=192944 RepID=UPI003641CFB6